MTDKREQPPKPSEPASASPQSRSQTTPESQPWEKLLVDVGDYRERLGTPYQEEIPLLDTGRVERGLLPEGDAPSMSLPGPTGT